MLPRRTMIKRMLCAGLGLAVARLRAKEEVACGGPLLERAIARAGGRPALEQGAVLKWTGKARIFASGKVIEIGVSTTVVPFTHAQSDSWPVEEGPKATRSLIIDGNDGWLVRSGVRTRMPEAMLKHERAQYALYGLMRLVTLCDPHCQLEVENDKREIIVTHDAAPTTVLSFDADDRLAGAHNRVPVPDGSGVLDQQILFTDMIVSKGGVVWPRRLKITQNEQPYFELELNTFEATPATSGPPESN